MTNKELTHQIILDYTTIEDFNSHSGGDVQRSNVCRPIYDPISLFYPGFTGYEEAADLGLGCGFPFLFVPLFPGIHLIDLGCAAGIDSFISHALLQQQGRVTGFDLTPALVQRAERIAHQKGLQNLHFIPAAIEALPLQDEGVDAVISNGVFSLLPNVYVAMKEIYRVLKPGGTVCIADINRKTDWEEDLEAEIRKQTGCLNGIYRQEHYLQAFEQAGFSQITIPHERVLRWDDHLAALQNQIYITTFRCIKV